MRRLSLLTIHKKLLYQVIQVLLSKTSWKICLFKLIHNYIHVSCFNSLYFKVKIFTFKLSWMLHHIFNLTLTIPGGGPMPGGPMPGGGGPMPGGGGPIGGPIGGP